MTGEFVSGPVQKLAARKLDDHDVLDILSRMTVAGITDQLGEPHIVTRYAEPRGNWRQGDGRPALADEDPAVMQAIGRCASSRSELWGPGDARRKVLRGLSASVHPERCGWCEYPAHELLAACDWAVFRSRFVIVEFAVWYADQEKRRGASYQRTLRQDIHENPTHAEFWALPIAERQDRIRAAQYPEGVPA